MRILQITYSLASGGAERFVVDMCNELVKNPQNEVYLLVIRDLNIPRNSHYLPELSKEVKCVNVGTVKGICLKSVMGVYKTIKKIKPNIVHTHCDTILLYLPALFYKKTKYVHTLHNVADKAISFKCLRRLEKWLFKKHIQPITISNFCQQSYIDFYKQDNAVCITNGRAELKTTELSEDVKKEVEGYKTIENAPVFIHVARYGVQKNQKLLFNTFLRIREEKKPFLLLVLGAGFEDSEFYHLNEFAEIKILGKKDNVGDYLACSNYFILSSNWEGLPLAMLEAMSMGCISVSTPAGGVVDVIKDGINGYLSPTFEDQDFYNTVIRAFDNKELIDTNSVINDYKERFTMDVCAGKYYSVYKKLI